MFSLQRVMVDGEWKLLRTTTGFLARECCCVEAPPSECCLYPNPQIESTGGTPAYPATDAVETIYVTAVGPYNSVTNEPFVRTPDADLSGFLWVGPTLPVYIDEDFMGNYTWRVYPSIGSGNTDWNITDGFGGGVATRPMCLIGDYSGGALVEDGFSDTLNYSLDTLPPDPLTGSIERQNNCEWGEGADEAQIVYGGDASEPYKWALEALGYSGWFIKDDPQDSPVGVYRQGADTVTITE
jgi:hypothetical protein